MSERTSTSSSALAAGGAGDTSAPLLMMEFYHQHVFRHLLETYRERLGATQIDRPLELRKRAFLSKVAPGREYPQQDAWDLCRAYLEAIEAEIAAVLRRHSLFFWVHLYRRIGVLLPPGLGDKTDPNTVGLVRQIVELAISKHADLRRSDDVSLASEVHFKDVLGGHYQRILRKEFGTTTAAAKFHALGNQWVITKFEIRDFIDIFLVEGYAYEYWRVTALMRAIGKGARFVVRDGDWRDVIDTPEFAHLIISYDHRIARVPARSSLSGAWFHTPDDALLRSEALHVPIYNIERHPSNLNTPEGLRLPPNFVPNFLLGSFDVQGFRAAHLFLAQAFAKRTGATLDAYLLSLWGISNIAHVPTRILRTQRESSDGADAEGTLFTSLINLLQRAYTLYANDAAALVNEILFRTEAIEGLGFHATRDELKVCVEQLTITEQKRDQIGLWSGGRRFPLFAFGQAVVLDLQGIPALLHSLFYRVQHDQTERGTVFEVAFQEALEAEKFEIAKIGRIVAHSGDQREIDASVRIGNKLVLFECRSIERPLDFELGQPKTIKTRCDFLNTKVDQALSLRDFILANPSGRNYNFGWATSVLTFVVSPFVEWIWDRSTRLWHDAETPRILQADEAIEYLHKIVG
jgi:hypothetical protein